MNFCLHYIFLKGVQKVKSSHIPGYSRSFPSNPKYSILSLLNNALEIFPVN